MLGVSWVIACRTLGGWLYLTMKLMSMISWTLFCYGGAVAFGGYYMFVLPYLLTHDMP